MPVVVLSQDNKGSYILVDGYKRLRALRRLRRRHGESGDLGTGRSGSSSIGAGDAQCKKLEGPLEQGWLLA